MKGLRVALDWVGTVDRLANGDGVPDIVCKDGDSRLVWATPDSKPKRGKNAVCALAL